MTYDDCVREMYEGLVASWTKEQIIEHIIYWRNKSDGLTAQAEADKTVQHLRRRIYALTKKLKATRSAAIEFMKGRRFDAMVSYELEAQNDNARAS